MRSSPYFHNYSIAENRFGEVTLWKCRLCGIIKSDKYKKKIDPQRIYNNYYYRNETVGRFLFGIEYIIRLYRLFRAFKIITLDPSAKSILDIGSGRGFMLYYLKKYFSFKHTVGTQIERNSYEFSKNKLGLEVYNKDLLDIDFKHRKFDLITIWHVLEHVESPDEYMKNIKKLLKRKGKLVIEVPNYDSWTRRFTGKFWLGLDLKYHLYFFNYQSLISLLKRYGYKIKKARTFSLEYSTFISTQSIISLLTSSDQVIFNWVQTGKFRLAIIFHIMLFILLSPICFFINILLYWSKFGEVLLVVAENE